MARLKPLAERWVFTPELDAALARQAEALAAQFGLSAVTARILTARGFSAPGDVEVFLARKLDRLHDPAKLPDIPQAVARIAAAIENGEKLVLFGDYDADGVTATALLARFLRLVQRRHKKFSFVTFLPERADGYGLTEPAVARILAVQPSLVVTLDNGTSAHAAVDAFNARGIDCVIVDHHHVPETLPAARAVINPHRPDAAYPFKELCGAGLAFKLAWALAVHFSHDKRVTPEFREFLLDAMGLAAIGTIADVVPLVEENRILAHNGLRALDRTQLPGLRALMELAALDPLNERIKPSDVSFRLAPRLNAAGRCASASEALELLMTEDLARARELAARLEKYNADRQAIEAKILDEARLQAQARLGEAPNCRGFVLGSEGWHAGVIGIVASRIVEEFNRPALLLSIDAASGLARGSGRGVRGLHLVEALAHGREHLTTFGGHAAAAGLSLQAERIPIFRDCFEAAALKMLADSDLRPALRVDARVRLEEVGMKLCQEIENFEPCGMGNPRPVFACSGLGLTAPPKLMGRDQAHFSFYVRSERAALRGVAFNASEHFNAFCAAAESGTLELAFRPKAQTFRGVTSVELAMESFR